MSQSGQDNSSPKLSRSDWIGFISMTVGMFMAILDIQIVASSLREIQAGLSASLDEINWIQTSYLIAEVIMIPISGWLARTFSTRYLFFFSCLGFTLMSLLCAVSWNLNSMIVFRTLQGAFGASMIPTVFSVIFIIFPLKMRPMITVMVGLIVTMAPTIGPILGGYLTESFSWHVLFLMNVIPGVFVCYSVWNYVNVDKPDLSLLKSIDYLGIFLITLALGCLQYVIEEGAKEDWFDSKTIVLFSSISAISFIFLMYHELKAKMPIIDLSAFTDRNFTTGCIFSFIIGWGLYNVVFLMPLYLASIKGFNSLEVGSYMFVTGAFQFLSAPLAGIASKKIDLRIMLSFGLLMFGLGTYLNSQLTAESAYWEFFLPQMISGMSLMFCFLPINTITFGTLPKEAVKNASGLYNLMRNLGGAIGLAITNTLLNNGKKINFDTMRKNITEVSDVTVNLINNLSSNFSQYEITDPNLAAIKQVSGLVSREALIISFNDAFVSISLIFLFGFCLMGFVAKVDPNADTGEAH